jgi:hypothetical protein
MAAPESQKVNIHQMNVKFGPSYAPFAGRFSVANNIQNFSAKIPLESQDKAIQSLLKFGILKPSALREGFSLKTIQEKDIKRSVTESRLAAAFKQMAPRTDEAYTMVEIFSNRVEPNFIARSVSKTTDIIWGLRTGLTNLENDSALSAGAKISNRTKLGLAVAFLSSTATACSSHAIASGLGVAAAATLSSFAGPAVLIGVAGASLYIYAKSPAFRDVIHRSILPILTFGAAIGMSGYLATMKFGPIETFAAFAGTMAAVQIVRGTISSIYERSRVKTLLNEDPLVRSHMVKRDVAYRVLGQLQDIRRGTIRNELWRDDLEKIDAKAVDKKADAAASAKKIEDVKNWLEKRINDPDMKSLKIWSPSIRGTSCVFFPKSTTTWRSVSGRSGILGCRTRRFSGWPGPPE